jgi:hypothetical protein
MSEKSTMDVLRAAEIKGETRRLRRFQREADRIARAIINTATPAEQIRRDIRALAEDARARFPGKEALFHMIYGSRFRRLWAQFRPGQPALCPAQTTTRSPAAGAKR